MKKKLLVFVIIAALVCAMMGITASAAPAFDKSVLRTFTEGFSVKEVMGISGEGDFEQTENKTFLIDVVEGTAASVSYACTGDRADGLARARGGSLTSAMKTICTILSTWFFR